MISWSVQRVLLLLSEDPEDGRYSSYGGCVWWWGVLRHAVKPHLVILAGNSNVYNAQIQMLHWAIASRKLRDISSCPNIHLSNSTVTEVVRHSTSTDTCILWSHIQYYLIEVSTNSVETCNVWMLATSHWRMHNYPIVGTSSSTTTSDRRKWCLAMRKRLRTDSRILTGKEKTQNKLNIFSSNY